MDAKKVEVSIVVSGPVGSGKSALLGEIEILMKALGVPCRYDDEDAHQQEVFLTHADWTEALDMYKPGVVLVEHIDRHVTDEQAYAAWNVYDLATQSGKGHVEAMKAVISHFRIGAPA